MDILTVILACSFHADDQLVEAFIRKVSGANPLFLGDFVTLATHDDLTSPDQVLELAAAISEKGGRPALGLMAIPISWAARFNRQPADLLDECTNVSIGTAMMAYFASGCAPQAGHVPHRLASKRSRRRGLDAVRACVLEGFDREIGIQGFAQILSEIPRLPGPDPDSDLPAQRSNVFDQDAPTVRPQVPIAPPPPSVSAPGQATPAQSRSSQSIPRAAPNPPPESEIRRGTASPSTLPAPIAKRPAGAARRPATPLAPQAPNREVPSPPTAVVPVQP